MMKNNCGSNCGSVEKLGNESYTVQSHTEREFQETVESVEDFSHPISNMLECTQPVVQSQQQHKMDEQNSIIDDFHSFHTSAQNQTETGLEVWKNNSAESSTVEESSTLLEKPTVDETTTVEQCSTVDETTTLLDDKPELLKADDNINVNVHNKDISHKTTQSNKEIQKADLFKSITPKLLECNGGAHLDAVLDCEIVKSNQDLIDTLWPSNDGESRELFVSEWWQSLSSQQQQIIKENCGDWDEVERFNSSS